MPITDAAFQNLIARKDRQVAGLLGRGQPVAPQSDPYAEKLQSHDLAIDRARARAETVLPERGPRLPEPAAPPDPKDTNVVLGDVSYSLFFLVRVLASAVGPERLVAALVAAVGPERVLSALRDLGHVRDFSE